MLWKHESRYILTSSNIRQDLPLRESTIKDKNNEPDKDNYSNEDNSDEGNKSNEDNESEINNFEDYSCPSFKQY